MVRFPNYDEISGNSLKELHHSIKKALDKDDSTPSGQDKPYGVRSFRDWKDHKAAEAAMKKRNISFEKFEI